MTSVDTILIVCEEADEELIRAENNYSNVLQQIKLSNPDYAEMISSDPQPLSEVQKVLDGQTAILEYWVGERGNTYI